MEKLILLCIAISFSCKQPTQHVPAKSVEKQNNIHISIENSNGNNVQVTQGDTTITLKDTLIN